MRRGFKCKKEALNLLIASYDDIVSTAYDRNHLKAIQDFEKISENELRRKLSQFYKNEKSLNQAWKTCKGELYEYATFKLVKQLVLSDKELREKFEVLRGEDALSIYGSQIRIRNWSDIFPDVDVLLVENGKVKVIMSCKTSLRERLTETAFWKRELERRSETKNIKLVFVTTNKDKELEGNTNRYMVLHVLDHTFITDPEMYQSLIKTYKRRYGYREDFAFLTQKISFIDALVEFLRKT